MYECMHAYALYSPISLILTALPSDLNEPERPSRRPKRRARPGCLRPLPASWLRFSETTSVVGVFTGNIIVIIRMLYIGKT